VIQPEVGAELCEFRKNEPVNTFTNGGEQYHRRDANGNAQGGEKTAHPLTRYGTHGQLYGIIDKHFKYCHS